MAVYTRYSKVLDAQGQPLTVRQALALINQTLDEVLAEQEGDSTLIHVGRWPGLSKTALPRASMARLKRSRRLKTPAWKAWSKRDYTSGRGKVRLLKPKELPEDWDPTVDKRLTAWEMVHHLIRLLEAEGESGAAQLMAQLGAKSETARELCYRLYTVCERKKRAAEALSYNALVQSWPEIVRLARESRSGTKTQAALF